MRKEPEHFGDEDLSLIYVTDSVDDAVAHIVGARRSDERDEEELAAERAAEAAQRRARGR